MKRDSSEDEQTQNLRTVGERVRERARERRASVRPEGAGRRRDDPADHASAPPGREETLRIVGRMLVFFMLVLLVYAVFRQLTYIVFAPDLEVLRTIVPQGEILPGEPVKLGVVVRNSGPLDGAAFVVAVVGGVEIEGATLEVPSRDTAVVTVEVALSSGTQLLSLVVFDGWRGVRRLETYRDLSVPVPSRPIEIERISLPRQAVRGHPVSVSIPWSNLGIVPETVVPVVVLRHEAGGPPLDEEGSAVELASGEARSLDFVLDTWLLRGGRYSVEVFLRGPSGERVGRGTSPLMLEVTEP